MVKETVYDIIRQGLYEPRTAQDITNLIGINVNNPLTLEVEEWIETNRSDKLRYLGLVGCQNGGKDFVANYLAQNIEKKCEVVKFATKLTEVVAAILGVTDLTLFQDREWKEKPHFIWQSNITSNNGKLISPREAQKIIGTDICRSLLGENVWVDAFANAYNDPNTLYIISDVRFQNEVDFIQQNNGVLIFIDNQEAAKNQRRKEAGVTHDSEKLMWNLHYGVQQSDYVLDNNNYSNPQPLQDLLTFINGI